MNIVRKNIFDGLHLCVTGRVKGFNRNELEVVLTTLGATLDKRVTSSTDILIAADSSRRRRTSKLLDAERYGVPLKTPRWLAHNLSSFQRYLTKLLPASVNSGTLQDRVKIHRWLRREDVTVEDLAILLAPAIYEAARKDVINSRKNLQEIHQSTKAAVSAGVFL